MMSKYGRDSEDIKKMLDRDIESDEALSMGRENNIKPMGTDIKPMEILKEPMYIVQAPMEMYAGIISPEIIQKLKRSTVR